MIMETEAIGESGGFAHMIKRIWTGPEEEGEPQKMQSARSETGSYDAQKNDMYGRGENGGAGNRPFRPDYPKRSETPEKSDFDADMQSSTVISRGTVITGDIKSDGDIEMYGTMTGSINTTGKVKINGKQTGDIQGSDVNLTDCAVHGNVSASAAILVDSGSVIVGDLKCGDLTFDGKMKGNVHVMGNVSCKGNAVVIGDITSTTITVESGARLQGAVQISDGGIDEVELPDEGAEAAPKQKSKE